MSGIAVKRGSVVRYAYLWLREHRSGQVEGLKDRPTLVLSLSVQIDNNRTRLLVVPVTHAPPSNARNAVEMPPSEKRKLGLDEQPAWIVTTESNTFSWPGPDIRPIPGKSPGTFVYGQLSEDLLRRVIESFTRNRKQGTIVFRDHDN